MSGLRGGTCRPVSPCTTVSTSPPTELAITGTPHAIASSGTIPNGSYQGTHTTASADRSRAGTSGRATAPSNRTRSATPADAASSRSRRTSGSAGSPCCAVLDGPPTTVLDGPPTAVLDRPPVLDRP